MYIPGWGEFVSLIEWALIQLAQLTGNSGLAIIALTILIKLAMVPLTLSSLRSAKRMQELQPMIKELQRKYANDRQLLSAETMKLYQEHRVNPFGSCLPLVIQMPIFIGLYYAILNISTNEQYGNLGTNFLWIPSIALPDPLFILPVVVVVTQFIQQKMAIPQKIPGQVLDPQQQMMNQMLLFMPIMVGVFAWNFAAGAVIYWITQNIFSAVQQYFITGFGSLRDLPGLSGLPVPSWVTPPTNGGGGGGGGGTTRAKSTGSSTPARPTTPATGNGPSSGALGKMYDLINRRVETIQQQRADAEASSGAESGDQAPRPAPDADEAAPSRRSSRRARPRR